MFVILLTFRMSNFAHMEIVLQNRNEREKLIQIYERLKQLKADGVKMKDIARRLELIPSVLSGLYTTVLPAFCRLSAEKPFDDALGESLAYVNNLSKKRLLEHLDTMYERLENYETMPKQADTDKHPFLDQLQKECAASVQKAEAFEGIYMSYSCSSSVRALKAEPFYLTVSPDRQTFVAGRKSVHNSIREGIGIIKEQQILYLLFNAFREPNLSLVTVYLQLPFLEEINLLKGLYLVLDYNKNPIARRIVLVRRSARFSADEFQQMEARLIMQHEFTEEEQLLYNYTCGDSDALKMCTLPSPKLDLRDLQQEKILLELDKAHERPTSSSPTNNVNPI